MLKRELYRCFQKLFIAQSALSRQMKLLEEEIDFLLFDRTDKRVKLTVAGEVFYKKIKDNLLYLNEIIDLSKSVSEGKIDRLKLLIPAVLSWIIQRFRY